MPPWTGVTPPISTHSATLGRELCILCSAFGGALQCSTSFGVCRSDEEVHTRSATVEGNSKIGSREGRLERAQPPRHEVLLFALPSSTAAVRVCAAHPAEATCVERLPSVVPGDGNPRSDPPAVMCGPLTQRICRAQCQPLPPTIETRADGALLLARARKSREASRDLRVFGGARQAAHRFDRLALTSAERQNGERWLWISSAGGAQRSG